MDASPGVSSPQKGRRPQQTVGEKNILLQPILPSQGGKNEGFVLYPSYSIRQLADQSRRSYTRSNSDSGGYMINLS